MIQLPNKLKFTSFRCLYGLKNSTLKNQGPKMGLQKAPQALRWLENSTLKNQGPKMGLQEAPQVLRWLEDTTLKVKVQK